MSYSKSQLDALVEGRAHLSQSGDWWNQRVFVMGAAPRGRDVLGASFLKKIGRGVKGVGRGIGKGAKATVKVAKKGAMITSYPARQAAHAAAWLAFAPVRLICNQIIANYVGAHRKRGIPATGKQGRSWLYAVMAKSKNPVLRGGVVLLRQFGPGSSPKVRISGLGADFVGAAPAAAGVAALQSALLIAKPILIKMAIAASLAAANKAIGARGGAPTANTMNVSVPDEPLNEPSTMEVNAALEPDSEMNGWGC